MYLLRLQVSLALLVFFSGFLPLCASENKFESFNQSIIHGYISNKIYNPLKLKVSEVDKNSLFLIDRNLENNSYIPFLNLKIIAETSSDYYLAIKNPASSIFIPQGTKLTGYISEIKPSKSFNRQGLFKATFNSVTCPDGENIYLKSNITSRSKNLTYNPLHHIGKTTLSLLGGSLAGTLLSYQFGGLGLVIATHGYSLASGALGGGFIGVTSGITSNGKEETIEPGQELIISPVDDISLEELKQITCKEVENEKNIANDKNLGVEILSVKEKKDFSGDTLVKIEILFTNNSNDCFRLNNFFLRDSQGNEYTTSFLNANSDLFTEFLPSKTKKTILEFFVEHPKATHWLVLKDRNFTGELGKWKIN